jgi:aryl-alcohol dehydrogenase-like predicted oxidoreductase
LTVAELRGWTKFVGLQIEYSLAERTVERELIPMAWLRYRDIPVIPIIGARRIAQLQDNLASLTLELTEKQLSRLNEASAIELGFPNELYGRDLGQNLMYGGMRDQILAA